MNARFSPTVTRLSRLAPTRYVKVGSADVAWRSFGMAGHAPALVLLQRFRGTMDHWDPELLDQLAADREVILFDSLGVGRSSGDVPVDIAGMADAAASIIRSLRHTHVDLLGWSMGGMVAQQLCLAHPDLVRRAVIAGSTPGPVDTAPRAPEKVWQVATKPANDDEDFLYLFWTRSARSIAAGHSHMARLLTRDEPFSIPVSAEAFRRQVGAIMGWATGDRSAIHRAHEMTQPLLVAAGSHDIMAAPEASFALAKAAPNARLTMYPDGGHAFLFDDVARFARDVNAFLND